MKEEDLYKREINERICNKCGWVHFGMTYEQAQGEVDGFNRMYEELTEGEKQRYYGGHGATVASYEHCFRCGNSWQDFSEAKEDDCPVGVTIQPIIVES